MSWSTIYNQLTAQFYHVAVDDQHPYRVYTQQDNSSVSVPSASENGGITWGDCYPAGTGESGYIGASERGVRRGGGELARGGASALRSPDPPDPAGHGLARGLLRLGRQGPPVPLRLDLPHRLLAPRPRHALRDREPGLPDAGRGSSWEAISPDLGRTSPGWRRPEAPSPRTRAAPSTTPRCTPSRSPSRERGVLWGGVTTAWSTSPGTTADLAERHAARSARVVADRDDRALAARAGHGLPRGHALQDRRLPPLPLQDRGPRPDLAQSCHGVPGRRDQPGDPGRPRPPRSPLRRDGDGRRSLPDDGRTWQRGSWNLPVARSTTWRSRAAIWWRRPTGGPSGSWTT